MSRYDTVVVRLTPTQQAVDAARRVVASLRQDELQLAGVTPEMLAAGALPLDVAVAGVVCDTLDELGYTRTLLRVDDDLILWAQHGHEILAVAIRPDGRATLDHAGVLGDVCHDRMAALTRGVAGRGLEWSIARTTDHGDARGGALVRRIAPHRLSRVRATTAEEARATPTPLRVRDEH